MNLSEKWKLFVEKLNSKGIPLPMIRDPKNPQGSVTLTLVFLSSTLMCLSIIFMLATAVSGLASDFVLNAQTAAQIKSAFDCSFQFLIAALSAYVGRKFQRDSKGDITVAGDPKNDPPQV